eukprot:1976563-Pleurochrysis_carterae.AAC.3
MLIFSQKRVSQRTSPVSADVPWRLSQIQTPFPSEPAGATPLEMPSLLRGAQGASAPQARGLPSSERGLPSSERRCTLPPSVPAAHSASRGASVSDARRALQRDANAGAPSMPSAAATAGPVPGKEAGQSSSTSSRVSLHPTQLSSWGSYSSLPGALAMMLHVLAMRQRCMLLVCKTSFDSRCRAVKMHVACCCEDARGLLL